MQKCPNFPEPESQTAFKLEMIEVLRNAKQRYRNSLKQNNSRRKLKPEQEIEVDEERDFLSEEDDEGNNSNSENEHVQLSQDRQIEDRQSERNDSSSNESDA